MEQSFIDALADGLGPEGFLQQPMDTYRAPRDVQIAIGQVVGGQGDPPIMMPASGSPGAIDIMVDDDYELPPANAERDREIDEAGVEAIAWYVSFHVSRVGWGIYLAEDGIEAFARRTFGAIDGLTDAEKLRLGLQAVLDHELFHYWTDVACAQIEFAGHKAIYVPYLSSHPDLSSPVCQAEEALANARAWHAAKSSAVRTALAVEMEREPQGYRDWGRYRSLRAFALGKRRLGADIHMGPAPPPSPPLPAVTNSDSDEERAARVKRRMIQAAEMRLSPLSPPAGPPRWGLGPYDWFFDSGGRGLGRRS